MISSLTTYLALVVVLGVWHAILVWLRGEPTWARTVIRVILMVATVVQAVGYVVITQLTADVPIERASDVLNQVSSWALVIDGTTVVLLGIGAVILLGLSIRRAGWGPVPTSVTGAS